MKFNNRGGIVADFAGVPVFLAIWGEKPNSKSHRDGTFYQPHQQHLLYCTQVPEADQSPSPYSTPHSRCPVVSTLSSIRLYILLL